MVMRLVFDADSWVKVGDQDNNEIFWKPAEIIKVHNDGTVDVMFEDGRISKGHFYNQTKPLKNVFQHSDTDTGPETSNPNRR